MLLPSELFLRQMLSHREQPGFEAALPGKDRRPDRNLRKGFQHQLLGVPGVVDKAKEKERQALPVALQQAAQRVKTR